jgi:hypothetical protein
MRMVGRVAGTVIGLVEAALGAIGGCVGVGFEWLFSSLVNRGKGRPLSDRSMRAMSGFFPRLDLNEVELVTGATLAVASRYKGLTLGNRIYLRKRFDECSLDPNGQPRDMKLLMHELVHVEQYHRLGWFRFACQYGKGALSTWDHDNIPLEREAISFVRANENSLKDIVSAICAEAPVV